MFAEQLLTLIAQQPCDEQAIEKLIRQVEAKQANISLKELLAFRQPGTLDTPLHLACRFGHTAVVRLLLSVGADPLLMNHANQQPKDSIADDEDKQNEIRILLYIHNYILEIADKAKIDFPRTLFLINQVFHGMNKNLSNIKKEGFLFLGDTKKGKSTLINAFVGIKYQFDIDEASAGLMPYEGEEEKTKVGISLFSETFAPVIVHSDTYMLVDMPGLTDNRDKNSTYDISPYEIAAAVGTKLLNSQVTNLRGIVLVVTMNDLVDSNIEALLKPFKKIVGLMGEQIKNILENTALVITKKDLVAPRLLQKQPDFYLGQFYKNLSSFNSEDEYMPGVKTLIEHFITHSDHIVVADLLSEQPELVSGPTIRMRIEQLFEQKSAFPCEQLNLGGYSTELVAWEQLVIKLEQIREKHIGRLSELQEKMKQLCDSIEKTRGFFDKANSPLDINVFKKTMLLLESYQTKSKFLQISMDQEQQIVNGLDALYAPIFSAHISSATSSTGVQRVSASRGTLYHTTTSREVRAPASSSSLVL